MQKKLWQVCFDVPRKSLDIYEAAFEDVGVALSVFPTACADVWTVEVLCDFQPDIADIQNRLKIISPQQKEVIQSVKIAMVADKNWLKEVERQFPPRVVGDFYLYGPHVKAPVSAGKTGIKIQAATAFGSGEHPTTQGCLTAIGLLKNQFKSVLDVGCGSGILAIAVAQFSHVPVDAVDNDPEAVRMTVCNARENAVTDLVHVWQSEGYAAVDKTYDLILCNIFARPLMEMAPLLAAHLNVGGVAVLSGFLKHQVPGVAGV